jgi:hypothetical protein
MATNFDALVVRFSRKIDDAVSATGTDGDQYTSLKRVEWLNSGIKNWLVKRLSQSDWVALAGYIQTKTQAMTANAASFDATGFTGGIQWILSIVNTTPTTNVPVTIIDPKYVSDITLSRIEGIGGTATDQKAYIQNNSINVIGSGATDTLSVTYVQKHTDLTSGGVADISIASPYWHEILEEAYRIFTEEYPSKDNTARLMVRQ